jgi:hypothetical protein
MQDIILLFLGFYQFADRLHILGFKRMGLSEVMIFVIVVETGERQQSLYHPWKHGG